MPFSLPVLNFLEETDAAAADENRRVVRDCHEGKGCGGCGMCCIVPSLKKEPGEHEEDPSGPKQRWEPCARLAWEVVGTRRVARCTLQDQKGRRADLEPCVHWGGGVQHGHFTLGENMNRGVADDILSRPASFLLQVEMFLKSGLLDPEIIDMVRCRLEASEDETNHFLHRLLVKNDAGALPRLLIAAIGLPELLARYQPAWIRHPAFQPWASPLHAEFARIYNEALKTRNTLPASPMTSPASPILF